MRCKWLSDGFHVGGQEVASNLTSRFKAIPFGLRRQVRVPSPRLREPVDKRGGRRMWIGRNARAKNKMVPLVGVWLTCPKRIDLSTSVSHGPFIAAQG